MRQDTRRPCSHNPAHKNKSITLIISLSVIFLFFHHHEQQQYAFLPNPPSGCWHDCVPHDCALHASVHHCSVLPQCCSTSRKPTAQGTPCCLGATQAHEANKTEKWKLRQDQQLVDWPLFHCALIEEIDKNKMTRVSKKVVDTCYLSTQNGDDINSSTSTITFYKFMYTYIQNICNLRTTILHKPTVYYYTISLV